MEKAKINEERILNDGRSRKNPNARRLAKERNEYRKMQLLLEKKERMEKLANRKLQEQQIESARSKSTRSAKTTVQRKQSTSLEENKRDLKELSMKFHLVRFKRHF